jgi:hypothetical protein
VKARYRVRLCMALTPDAIPHLSPSLTAPDPAADAGLAEGLAALESYKKKDPAKGTASVVIRMLLLLRPRTNGVAVYPSPTPQSSCASKRLETRR